MLHLGRGYACGKLTALLSSHLSHCKLDETFLDIDFLVFLCNSIIGKTSAKNLKEEQDNHISQSQNRQVLGRPHKNRFQKWVHLG